MDGNRAVGFGECGGEGGSNDLLLAPIQETGADEDPIYLWLEKLEGEKERLEEVRLLYVAATRAKQRLHLLGSTSATQAKDGALELKVPPNRSLLGRIWPVVASGICASRGAGDFLGSSVSTQ